MLGTEKRTRIWKLRLWILSVCKQNLQWTNKSEMKQTFVKLSCRTLRKLRTLAIVTLENCLISFRGGSIFILLHSSHNLHYTLHLKMIMIGVENLTFSWHIFWNILYQDEQKELFFKQLYFGIYKFSNLLLKKEKKNWIESEIEIEISNFKAIKRMESISCLTNEIRIANFVL